MAEWKQKRGDYPFQDWQDMPENKDAPEYAWKQKIGDYPFKIWQDMPDSKDAPDILWKQKQGSYPFKSWQKMPSMPNYAKKTTQIVVVPNCKTQTIIITKYKQQIISMIDGVIT